MFGFFFCSIKKIKYIMKKNFEVKKISFDTKDADTLACFSAVLFLPSGVVLDFYANPYYLSLLFNNFCKS